MFVLYIIAGLLGGLLGGMGMGGGTLLIPLLTIFFGISQLNAQAINLIAFIPMAVVALILHLKNKLVKFTKCLIIILPGLITCVIGCFIAQNISGNILKKSFGGFLLTLAVFQIIDLIIKKRKSK